VVDFLAWVFSSVEETQVLLAESDQCQVHQQMVLMHQMMQACLPEG
jgi:hypothetical protein